MDACYDEDDDDEKDAFNGAMNEMWTFIEKSGPLPTTRVQQVETESKKLKNDIEKKDQMLKAIDEKRYLIDIFNHFDNNQSCFFSAKKLRNFWRKLARRMLLSWRRCER